MPNKALILAIGALVILSIGGAFWLGMQDARTPGPLVVVAPPSATGEKAPPPSPPDASDESIWINTTPPQPVKKAPAARENGRVIEDEIVLQFGDRESYEEALRLLTEAGVSLRGGIGPLGMLRVELPPGGIGQLENLLGERIVSRSNNVQVTLPEPIELPANGQLAMFGADWLAMIGAPEDNADWGRGVRIAVIDSGVTRPAGLQGARIDRYPLIEERIENYHGNAVTSLIVGNGEPGQARGLAPAAEILAYQALGEESGDAFTIAKAIVDAVDHGANIINLSLGGWGDTPVVRSAVQYADEAGVVIVAAVGNDRLDQITYPAAYDEVIAVTSVDAGFHWAEYPNAGLEGKWPDIAAPGVGLLATYSDDGTNLAFSGTSAATPVVSAAIAAQMSQTNATAKDAAAVILAQANDRGEPGADPYLGVGVIDMTRALRANERGVVDLAVSDHYVDPALANNEGLPVRIGIQNRGTTGIANPVLTLMIGSQNNRTQIQLPPIKPGEVIEYDALIPIGYFQTNQPAGIASHIGAGEAEDINPDNNVIVSAYGVTRDDAGKPNFVEARQE